MMLLDLAIVFSLTLFLLNKFANIRQQHSIVILSTFIGWFSSFMIIYMLPEDIAVAFYKRCLLEKTNSTKMSNASSTECGSAEKFVSDHVLLSTWRVMYWTAQLLTWQIVLPLMQSYSNAGDFTVVGKLRSAAYNNAVYYGIYLTVFIFLLFYAALKGVSLNAEHLKVIIISASNTWGLFLLVALLGYGLVEVPRQLWLMGVKGYRLNKTYFDIDKLSADKNEAEDALKEVYQEARSVLSLLRNEHVLREYAQTVLAKFPVDVATQLTSSCTGSFSGASSIAPANEALIANEKYLIRLHKRVITAIQNHHRTQAQWNALVRRALYLEDVQHADDVWAGERYCMWDFRPSKKSPAALQHCPNWIVHCWRIEQFAWHVAGKRSTFKVLALISCVFSVVVVWSECTFFIVRPTLSVPALLVDAAARLYDFGFLMEVLSYSHYFYIVVCKVYIDTDRREQREARWVKKEFMQEMLGEARSVLSLLRNEHVLREYAQTVLAKFPVDVATQLTSSCTGSFSGASSIAPANEALIANEKYLIRLHKRVITAIQNHHRTQAQWNALVRRALYLEDVQHADDVWAGERYCMWDFRPSKKSPAALQHCPNWIVHCWRIEQFAWHVAGKRSTFKVLALISCVFSVVVVWSECTFFIVRPTLSVPALLVDAAARLYDFGFLMETIAFYLISYLCICAYYTVFKLRIYRYYHLDPNHMTDENSLLFSATLLCRLTPALCLNVLGMIHLDSHIAAHAKFPTETQFTKLMGHLDVIPILAKGLNIYLPIFVLLLCMGTYFRLGTRFLHSLGIDQFVDDDEMTAELVQGGKAHVTLERNKMLRAASREQRDQYWAGRLAEYGTGAANTQDYSGSSSYRARREAPLKNARFMGVREYGDIEPIVSADEGVEESVSLEPQGPNRADYGSPSVDMPPSNIFDDL
ncbi:LMBR1 domain-containing protein 2 -like protein [Toxocara canis]|uniref:LMBR1 domain-containing protein 2-like protein n=1 Tax=Toxocara canis TaxID=6265 RepID=A0A0B2W2B7_TOXCA|nr:LMBR1 domain-containing protein 2 -like protein [Toxocara canis]